MNFEEKINNINNETFVKRRLNQIKYLMYDYLSISKDGISIDIVPRFHKSKKSEKFVDVWDLEIYINIKVEVDPILDELSYFIKTLQKSYDKIFAKIGIDQFLDIIKDPNRLDHSHLPMLSKVEWSNNLLEIDLYIDYETIAVEGAGDL
jgi:hypothetical protein